MDQIKQACSATETSLIIEISLEASFQLANDKCADQSSRMRRLVCAFVVRKPRRLFFSRRGPYDNGVNRIRQMIHWLNEETHVTISK